MWHYFLDRKWVGLFDEQSLHLGKGLGPQTTCFASLLSLMFRGFFAPTFSARLHLPSAFVWNWRPMDISLWRVLLIKSWRLATPMRLHFLAPSAFPLGGRSSVCCDLLTQTRTPWSTLRYGCCTLCPSRLPILLSHLSTSSQFHSHYYSLQFHPIT